MIKINKDLEDLPLSLRVDPDSIKHNPTRTTYERRKSLIALGRFPLENSFTSRYKYEDIKEKLFDIYHKKCAYCENAEESLNVEHFRPKGGGYYWLAYSWDNLLLSCPTCNRNKSNQFPIKGSPVKYDPRRDTPDRINELSSIYDAIEEPLLVNPESVTSSILDSIVFGRNGEMSSTNPRMETTISVCKLNRKALQERRQKIWDDLKNEIEIAWIEAKGNQRALVSILKHVMRVFLIKSGNPNEEFLAYRRYLIVSGWIKEVLREYAH